MDSDIRGHDSLDSILVYLLASAERVLAHRAYLRRDGRASPL